MAVPWAMILPESAPGLILTGPDHQDRKRWDAREGKKGCKEGRNVGQHRQARVGGGSHLLRVQAVQYTYLCRRWWGYWADALRIGISSTGIRSLARDPSSTRCFEKPAQLTHPRIYKTTHSSTHPSIWT